MAASTLANKGISDMQVLSLGIGVDVCVGLSLGFFPWWHCLVILIGSNADEYAGIVVETEVPRSLLEEKSEAWDFDAERITGSTPQKPAKSSFEGIVRILKFVLLLLTLVILTIGPNFGYVLVVLSSELTQQQKVASEMAVTLAKTAIGTLLVPRMARRAVNLLVLHDALTYVRFR
jgi:hypothetical protein